MRLTLLLCCILTLSFSTASSQTSPETLFSDGFAKYTEGKYNEAIATFLKADSTRPLAKLLFYLGSSYAALNDYLNAINALQKSVGLEPNNSGNRYQLARMFAQSGLANDAAREYLAITQTDTSYLPAFFQLGLIHTDRRQFREALQLNRYIINNNPRDFLAYYQAASSYVSLGENDSARMAIDSCLSINPKYIPAINLSASLYFSKKNYHEARQQYLLASVLRPEKADFIFKVGLCEAKLDSHTLAIESFKKAIALDSLDESYYANLGQAYYKASYVDSSLTAYSKAAEIDNENPIVFINLALAWAQLDSTNNAVATYNRAVATYHPEKISEVYMKLGSLFFGKSRYREAIIAFQKAREFQPSNLLALFYTAWAYENLDDKKNAIRELERFLNLAGHDTTKKSHVNQAKWMLNQLKNKN